MPEDGVHAAHQPGLKDAGVEQGRALRLLHRVQRPRIEEDALPGLQRQAGLVHIHIEGALYGEDVFKFLMPVPRHRVAGQVFGVAGDGKQRTAVLHKFPALFAGDDVGADI